MKLLPHRRPPRLRLRRWSTPAPNRRLRAALMAGVGFRVQGSGFRVWGLGFKVWGLRFRVQGLGSRVSGSGSKV